MEQVKKLNPSKYSSYLKDMLSFTESKDSMARVLNNVLKVYPTISDLLGATPEILKQTTTLSDASIELISLLKAIAKKLDNPISSHQKLNTTLLAKNFCGLIFEDYNVEQFFCLCLDQNCKLLSFTQLGYGTSSNANLRMKQIMECAFKVKSKNIIICHNHPNGTMLPSDNDILFTKRLCLNLMLNDVALLDHIIITKHSATSMLEFGTLEPMKVEIFNNTAIPNKKSKQHLIVSPHYKIDNSIK